MKRTILLGVAVLALAWAGNAFADPESDAVCHVFVEVDPNIGVLAMAPYIDLGSVQTGLFSGIIPFRVDANTEQVRISAACSNLYKGDDPDTVIVPPIPVYDPPEDPLFGISIVPTMGNPTGGHTHMAAFTQATTVDGFPAMLTETLTFESAQNNHFSQQVDLTCTWIQEDPEKPMGEYSGKVQMFAWAGAL